MSSWEAQEQRNKETKKQRNMKEEVLGVGVDVVGRRQAVEAICRWIEKGSQESGVRSQENTPLLAAARAPLDRGELLETRSQKPETKIVVTAYSEFFVRAREDDEFKRVLSEADLVVPDGVSVLAAVDYKRLVAGSWELVARIKNKFRNSMRGSFLSRVFDSLLNVLWELWCLLVGLWVGLKVITGNIGQPVTGVWLVEELLKLANEKKWRVFLLGGYGDTAEGLKEKIQEGKLPLTLSLVKRGKNGVIVEADAGSQKVEKVLQSRIPDEENQRVIKKINEFVPDLLLVAYGPGKQEMWLNRYKSELYASVGIGVGGTFDELSGKIKRAPGIFEKMGLKWLWRLMLEPRRFKRIWRAVAVFPWLVWREERTRWE